MQFVTNIQQISQTEIDNLQSKPIAIINHIPYICPCPFCNCTLTIVAKHNLLCDQKCKLNLD